jgi:pimeloyl-ACP methyl ester carboxylesterase
MTVLFRDSDARAKVEAAYERFRSRLPAHESIRVPTRHGETHVLATGPKDAPPLVVVHGALASSAHVMGEIGPALREQFRVFAPDVVGQSVMSADVRLPVDGPAYAEWLGDVLDGLSLSRAHIFGVSWGGFVARSFAQAYPERVDKLVLLVPAGFVGGPVWKGLTKVGIPLAMYRAFPSEARLRRFASAILSTLDDEWLPYMGEAFLAYKLDMRIPPLAEPEDLAAFDRPTLVIGASDDLSFPGAALLERAKALIPHAETELLEDCKHSPPTNDAFRAKLAERIARFLRSPSGPGPS